MPSLPAQVPEQLKEVLISGQLLRGQETVAAPSQDSDSLPGLRKPSAAEIRALQPGGSIYEPYEPFYTGPPPMASQPGGAFSVEVQGTEVSIRLRGQPFQSEECK